MKNLAKFFLSKIKALVLFFQALFRITNKPHGPSLYMIMLFVFLDFVIHYFFSNALMNARYISLLIITSLLPYVMGAKISTEGVTKTDLIVSTTLMAFYLIISIVNLLPNVINHEISNTTLYAMIFLILIWSMLDLRHFKLEFDRLRTATPTNPELNDDGEGNAL